MQSTGQPVSAAARLLTTNPGGQTLCRLLGSRPLWSSPRRCQKLLPVLRRCWLAATPAALATALEHLTRRPSCGNQPLPVFQPALQPVFGSRRSRGPRGRPGWPGWLLRDPRGAPGALRGRRMLRAVARARFAWPRAIVHRERLFGEVVHHKGDCAEAPCVNHPCSTSLQDLH